MINNVWGLQYNAYVERRDSFLEKVAATRTKARWLVWLGALCYVAGFLVFLAAIVDFMMKVFDAMESDDPRPPVDILGPEIAGVPAGLLGFGAATVGTVLLGFGIVLHVVATSRHNRIERELPERPPWPVPGLPGSDQPMSQNIYDQHAGLANNIVGTQNNYGGQYGTQVTTGDAQMAVQQLREVLAGLPLDATTAAEARARVAEIEIELRAPQPDQSRVAGSLDRLTRLLSAAGSFATAAGRLVSPLRTLATWAGSLGEQVLRLLPG
jgi:hypothetical protein